MGSTPAVLRSSELSPTMQTDQQGQKAWLSPASSNKAVLEVFFLFA